MRQRLKKLEARAIDAFHREQSGPAYTMDGLRHRYSICQAVNSRSICLHCGVVRFCQSSTQHAGTDCAAHLHDSSEKNGKTGNPGLSLPCGPWHRRR